MPPDQTLDFDVHDLPMDVFDLTVSGLEVQTLTLGRGMDVVASCCGPTRCIVGCGGCSCLDKPEPIVGPDEEEEE
ncbi:thiomuracin/GE37468 family thiazolyl RiPP peptide [Nonomuraea sp. NPDC050022]|uniref:thiomuracin/GE37468 family thiazolyl RiPP peptide n=1 Tax=unclassified Nonomuraea TaxID=2593643 RepID=UPI0033C26E43